MATNDPPGQGGGSAHPADDALRRLEQRLDAASEAAERLLADAAARATRKPPPAGWQQRRGEAGGEGKGGGEGEGDGGGLFGADTDVLLGLVAAVRDRIPRELQQRLVEAVREVLLALRALIDWCLDRIERRASEPTAVQDIPIL
jgi:hypothetical protein